MLIMLGKNPKCGACFLVSVSDDSSHVDFQIFQKGELYIQAIFLVVLHMC